jgi:hypothetical protein
MGHFFGIFEIFRGGKVTPDHNIGKFYILNILYNHQDKQICFSEAFPEVHRL